MCPLELAFETKFLRDLCEDHSLAEAKLGVAVARSLRRRLADLRAAKSVFDLPFGVSTSKAHCTIALAGATQLKLAPNHLKNPRLPSGEMDWTQVGRLKVIEIA